VLHIQKAKLRSVQIYEFGSSNKLVVVDLQHCAQSLIYSNVYSQVTNALKVQIHNLHCRFYENTSVNISCRGGWKLVISGTHNCAISAT